jgi:hypothetical protein
MPNPSQVSAQNVNSELGAGATTQLSFANSAVQSLTGAPNTFSVITTAVFSSAGSGSNTAPTNATGAFVHVWGGGGGPNELRGGGGSGYSRKFVKVVGGSTVISYNVGAGGAAVNGGTGGTGGTSNAQISGNSTTWGSTGGQGAPRAINALGGSGSGGDVNEDSAGGATSGTGGQAGGTNSLTEGGGLSSGGAANPYGGGAAPIGVGGGSGADGAVKIVWINQSDTKMGKMRWGINFPGGDLNAVNTDGFEITNTFSKIYQTGILIPGFYKTTKTLSLLALNSGQGSASGNVFLKIDSNGVLTMSSTAGTTTNVRSITWLTSGSNSNYTANLVLYLGGGSTGVSGSATNTDLTLDTTRTWYIDGFTSGEQSVSGGANCELIIKDSGGILITRPVLMQLQVDSYP